MPSNSDYYTRILLCDPVKELWMLLIPYFFNYTFLEYAKNIYLLYLSLNYLKPISTIGRNVFECFRAPLYTDCFSNFHKKKFEVASTYDRNYVVWKLELLL